MQLELIEKLYDENLAELYVARLVTGKGPRLVTARRLHRQLVSIPGMVGRLQEASVRVASLSHPRILGLVGFFEAGGTFWWITERTTGFDLGMVFQRLSSREVRITPLRTLRIGVDFLEGLAALHEAGLTHGGLGPRQVLVDLDGVARLDGIGYEQVPMSFRELKQKTRRGRKDHLAPEIMQGRSPTPAGDVFSAASLIYSLLTGMPPLDGQEPGMSTRHQAIRPPSKLDRSLPYACDAVFIKALSIAQRQRHESGKALCNAVNQLRKSLVTGADEGHAGVADFIGSLYPNEARVPGMNGTIQRPARGDPVVLAPVAGPEAVARTEQPAAVPEETCEPVTPPAQARPADPGIPETAEPLEQLEQNGASAPPPDLSDERPADIYPDTAVMRIPADRDTALPEAPASSRPPPRKKPPKLKPSSKKPPKSPKRKPAPPSRAIARYGGRRPVPGPVPPWKRPAFLLAAGLTGLSLIVLFLIASGVISTDPEVSRTGLPAGQTSLVGFLSIRTGQPARVTLDGEVLPGKTPLVRKIVRAGRHRLLVETLSGRRLMDEAIEIPPGEHKEIRVVVVTPRPDEPDEKPPPTMTVQKIEKIEKIEEPDADAAVRKPKKRAKKRTRKRAKRRTKRKRTTR